MHSFLKPIKKIGTEIAKVIEKLTPINAYLNISMGITMSKAIKPNIIKNMGICISIIEIIALDCMFFPLISKAGEIHCIPIVWRKQI